MSMIVNDQPYHLPPQNEESTCMLIRSFLDWRGTKKLGPPNCLATHLTLAGKFVLIGVVSYGAGCAASTPGIYARVQGFLPWIKSLIADGKNQLSQVVSLVWVYLYPIQFLATYSVIKHLVFVSHTNGPSVLLIPKDFSHPILAVQ